MATMTQTERRPKGAGEFAARVAELRQNSDFLMAEDYTQYEASGACAQFALDVKRIGGFGQVVESATVLCERGAGGGLRLSCLSCPTVYTEAMYVAAVRAEIRARGIN